MVFHPEYVGYGAATLATVAFVPQVYKSVHTNDTKAISLPMYILFCTGIAMWLTYGIMIGDLPLIAANAVTFILSCTVLYLKIRNVWRHGEA